MEVMKYVKLRADDVIGESEDIVERVAKMMAVTSCFSTTAS